MDKETSSKSAKKAAKKSAKKAIKLMNRLSYESPESPENKENMNDKEIGEKWRAARQGSRLDNFEDLDKSIFSEAEMMAMNDREDDACENSPEFQPSPAKTNRVFGGRTEDSNSDDESLPDPDKAPPTAKKFKAFVTPHKKTKPCLPAVPKLTIREGKKVDITDGAGASSMVTEVVRPKDTLVDMTFSSGKLNLRY